MVGQARDSDSPDAGSYEQPEVQQQNSTRQSKQSQEVPKSQVGKLWDAFGSPEEPINTLPTAKYNNAEELKRHRDASASMQEVIKSGNGISDLTSFHKKPCARDSLLLGIGAGFGLGGVRGVLGGTYFFFFFFLVSYGREVFAANHLLGMRAIWPACSWAVYTFAATSVISFELCQRRRREEMDGMKRALDMMREIQSRKQRDKDQKKASEAVAAEEERKRKDWTNIANYKFW